MNIVYIFIYKLSDIKGKWDRQILLDILYASFRMIAALLRTHSCDARKYFVSKKRNLIKCKIKELFNKECHPYALTRNIHTTAAAAAAAAVTTSQEKIDVEFVWRCWGLFFIFTVKFFCISYWICCVCLYNAHQYGMLAGYRFIGVTKRAYILLSLLL